MAWLCHVARIKFLDMIFDVNKPNDPAKFVGKIAAHFQDPAVEMQFSPRIGEAWHCRTQFATQLRDNHSCVLAVQVSANITFKS